MDNIDNIPIKTEPPEEEANDGHIEGSSIVAQCKDEPDVPVTAVKQEGEEGTSATSNNVSVNTTKPGKVDSSVAHYMLRGQLYYCSNCNFKHKDKELVLLHCKEFDPKPHHIELNEQSHNDCEFKECQDFKTEIVATENTSECFVTNTNNTEIKTAHFNYVRPIAFSYRSQTSKFECGACKFVTEEAKVAMNHLKRHKHKNFYCYCCSYSTNYKLPMSGHLTTHITISQKSIMLPCAFKCDFLTKSLEKLIKHYFLHHISVFLCITCKQRFETISMLEAHIESEHAVLVPESKSIYKCLHCSFFTKYKNNLVLHILKFHKSNALKIPNSSTVSNLSEIKSNTDAEDLYSCSYCSFNALFQRDLKKHVIQTHPDKQRYYTCDLCKKYFESLHTLKGHLRTLHTERQRLFCMHCQFSTLYYRNLERHVKSHTGELPHLCQICGFRTLHSSILNKHIEQHLKLKEYNCSICNNYKTAAKQQLNKHLKTHNTERPFQCDKCDHRSKSNSHLNSHKKTHLANNNYKPFSCTLCDYRGKWKAQLNSHMTIHSVNADEYVFKCSFCPKKYAKKHSLTQHSLIHSDIKLQCKYCSYNTVKQNSLKVHEKSHSESYRWYCFQCPYSSNNRGNFIEHVNRTCSKAKYKNENLRYCYYCGFSSNHRSNFSKHVNDGCIKLKEMQIKNNRIFSDHYVN